LAQAVLIQELVLSRHLGMLRSIAMICLLGLFAIANAQSHVPENINDLAMTQSDPCAQYDTDAAKYERHHFSPEDSTACEVAALGPGGMMYVSCVDTVCGKATRREQECKHPLCIPCIKTAFKSTMSLCMIKYPHYLALTLCQIDYMDDFNCDGYDSTKHMPDHHVKVPNLTDMVSKYLPAMREANITKIRSAQSLLSKEVHGQSEQVTSSMASATLLSSVQTAAALLLGAVIGSIVTLAAFRWQRQERADVYIRA